VANIVKEQIESNSQQNRKLIISALRCGKYRQRTNCPKGMLSAKAIHNLSISVVTSRSAVANIVKEQIESNSQRQGLIVRFSMRCGKYRQRTNCPKGMLSAKAIHNGEFVSTTMR
jgi:hypothetical protein